MNLDPFEEKLRAQSFRQVPAAWRAELLARARRSQAALAAGERAGATESGGAWTAAGLRLRLAALLWPSPQAWAGLAAVWVGILALHLAGNSGGAPAANGRAPAAPAVLTALQEQKRVLNEVSEAIPPVRIVNRSKPMTPGPRSQAANLFLRS